MRRAVFSFSRSFSTFSFHLHAEHQRHVMEVTAAAATIPHLNTVDRHNFFTLQICSHFLFYSAITDNGQMLDNMRDTLHANEKRNGIRIGTRVRKSDSQFFGDF